MTNCGSCCEEFEELEAENERLKVENDYLSKIGNEKYQQLLLAVCGTSDVVIGTWKLETTKRFLHQYTSYADVWLANIIIALKRGE